jgi:hypothetical protein
VGDVRAALNWPWKVGWWGREGTWAAHTPHVAQNNQGYDQLHGRLRILITLEGRCVLRMFYRTRLSLADPRESRVPWECAQGGGRITTFTYLLLRRPSKDINWWVPRPWVVVALGGMFEWVVQIRKASHEVLQTHEEERSNSHRSNVRQTNFQFHSFACYDDYLRCLRNSASLLCYSQSYPTLLMHNDI